MICGKFFIMKVRCKMSGEIRMKILARFLSVPLELIKVSESDSKGWLLEWGNYEYYVLTNDEADDLYREHLDNLFEDTVLTQIPEHLQIYIDKNQWLDDTIGNSSRAEELADYDSIENDIIIGGKVFYIYRVC